MGFTAPAGRWPEIERLFDAASALPPDAQAPFLQRECADAALRDEVMRLLAAARASGDFLEAPPPAAESATPSLPAGAALGAWRVEKLLGRGGMSEVYLAHRADGQYRQHAALKLLSRELAQRAEDFRRERQLLAQLDHPLIARLLDGGLAADGRPYMVMEHVAGLNLVEHCRQAGAGLAERLRLFIQVCEAVAYAHRNLIVHRDLKPSNILVTGAGEVKLLDFGIARLVDGGLPAGDLTLHLTPGYAAPEQLTGRPIGTATDCYALGVLLHELLAGAPPFRLATLPLAVAVQRVLHETPPSLSAAAAASAQAPVAPRLLRGDLDSIAARALRKEPEARYASASELKADLERHLRHQPVSARGDALGYVLRRFVRRHAPLVALSGATVAALAVGLVTSLGYYVDARRARDEARAAAATLEAVDDFLNRDLLAGADIEIGATRDLTVVQLLERAAAQVGQRFADRPAVAARVHYSLAGSYGGLGRFEETRRHLEQALALYRGLGMEDSETALDALARLADIADQQDRHADSVRLFDEALHGATARFGARSARVLALRPKAAFANFHAGKLRRAVAELDTFFAHAADATGLDPAVVQEARARQGYFLYSTGQFGEAVQLLQATVAEQERALGAGDPNTAVSRMLLGASLTERGALAEAEAALQAAETTFRTLAPPGDPFIATLESFLGRLRIEQGRRQEGLALLESALAVREKVFGGDSSLVAWTRHQLAEGWLRDGRAAEAAAALTAALAVQERVDGPDHPFTLKVRITLAEALRTAGDSAAARQVLGAVSAQALDNLPPHHPYVAQLRHTEGLLRRAAGETALARRLLGEALTIYERRHGAEHPRTQRLRADLQTLTARR